MSSCVYVHKWSTLPNRLRRRSPVRRVHTTSHHTEFAPWSAWSMGGHVLLVFAGSRLAWVTKVPLLCNPVVESRLPVLLDPSRHSTQRHSHHFSHPTHCRTRIGVHNARQIAVLRFQFAWTVFHTHSSCRQKVGLLQSNVTCFLRSLPSTTSLIACT